MKYPPFSGQMKKFVVLFTKVSFGGIKYEGKGLAINRDATNRYQQRMGI
jgi:hypothetical protein